MDENKNRKKKDDKNIFFDIAKQVSKGKENNELRGKVFFDIAKAILKNDEKDDTFKKIAKGAYTLGMLTYLNMSVFQSVALAAFNQTDWNNFVSNTRETERNKTQTLITNTHTDQTPHVNTNIHSNTNPHSNTTPHTNTTGHSDTPGTHVNSYSDVQEWGDCYSDCYYEVAPYDDCYYEVVPYDDCAYSDCYIVYYSDCYYEVVPYDDCYTETPYGACYYDWAYTYTDCTNDAYDVCYADCYDDCSAYFDCYSDWSDCYSDWSDCYSDWSDCYSDCWGGYVEHVNYTNPHSQTYPHTEYSEHSNTYPHDNTFPHSNTYPHTNTGFDHQNYIPSKPTLYNIEQNNIVTGSIPIGLYSYDKNYDGSGAQDINSINVQYNLSIRKVKNSNGTSNISAWKTLVNDQASSGTPDSGYIYNLNTVDPLGTGNTDTNLADGYYEIKAIARNTPISGVAFDSPEQIISIRILNNSSPEISVTNGNEFINFTFSFGGALSPTNVYKRYDDGLYSGATQEQKHGILVRVTMIDKDRSSNTVQNWQKGKMYLMNSGGSAIATQDIIWENNSNIISSENNSKLGYAFFKKETYNSFGDLNNCKIVIEVTDYTDAGCTQPAGTTKTQQTVSKTDNTQLVLNINVSAPYVTATYTDYNNVTISKTVDLDYRDTSGIITLKQYKVDNQYTKQPTSGWVNYSGSILVNSIGANYIWYRTADNFGNERIGCFGPYNIGYLNSIKHNQVVKVGTTNVEVMAPYNLENGYTLPQGQTLVGNNEAVDGDILVYRLKLDIPNLPENLNAIKDIETELQLGQCDRDGINLKLQSAVLKKYNSSTNSYDYIKDLDYTSLAGDKYILKFGDISGNRVVTAYGSGEYVIEYKAKVSVQADFYAQGEKNIVVKNIGTVKIHLNNDGVADVLEPIDITNHKTEIETKVFSDYVIGE